MFHSQVPIDYLRECLCLVCLDVTKIICLVPNNLSSMINKLLVLLLKYGGFWKE